MFIQRGEIKIYMYIIMPVELNLKPGYLIKRYIKIAQGPLYSILTVFVDILAKCDVVSIQILNAKLQTSIIFLLQMVVDVCSG